MTVFKGLFTLQGPEDLLNKLQHDYERLEASPLDSYIAFDFFVTAEHMVDWLCPNDTQRQKEMRQGNILLQICSHIANGAKHFQATAKHHTSVQGAKFHEGAFQKDAFQSDAFDVPELTIELQGQAANELGNSIEVLRLAHKVLDFWKKTVTTMKATS